MERQSTRKLFKLVIALVALFTLALSVFAFGACGGEEHKHVYESTGTKTAANCGKIGVETFTCSCGDTYVAVTPATGSHSWGADGYCQTCGLPNFGAEGIDYSKIPDSFTAEDLDAIKEAITTSKGELTKEQQAAHEELGETLEDLQGSVGDLQDDLEDVQGSINALETLHKFDKTGAVKELTLDGTCTTYGVKFTLSTCDICGATFLTGIAKNAEVTGHKYVKDAARSKDPVCGIPGVDVFECSVCKDTYSVSVIPENPDLTHKIDESSKQTVIEATCQRTGLVYYTCSLCGVTVSQQTPKTDHQADTSKDKTIVPATCLTDGEVEHTCKNCDTKYTETIKALGHQPADDPVIYDCTYNSPLNGYYCTREGCDNEYVAESVLREALKEGEEVKFHQPLEHLSDAEFETKYKKAAHEYVYGNFSQGDLCGSDASYTIECPNCHEFTDHGEFTITAEYWFKNGVKDWDPDFTAFLFKTEGTKYATREGDAYRPAHTHDAAATLQVEYVLREFVSNEEWNSLNPVNDGPNKHTVMKTAYYACKDCSFANDAKDGSVIKDALAEENAVPEVYKDLMEKKSEKHTMTPLWKNDVDKGVAIPQTVLDALEDKYCDWNDLLFPRDANNVQQITDDVVTLNVHHDVTVSWYCTDTTCNDGHPATYTHTYKWTGTHTWGDDWQNTWTAEDAISHGWTLVEGTETEDTCTVGVWMRQCTNKSCPDVKEYNTVAPRHKFADNDAHKVTPATCTTDGKESGTCEACGKTMEDVVNPALGHNFNYESDDEGWTTVTPAGHGKKGLEHRPCLRCHGELEGGWEPRDIPATNAHTWETNPDGTEKVYVTCEPSCSANGTGYWLCKECGAQLSVGIPAMQHWYYKDISREEGAEMTEDQLLEYLNVVGNSESVCLMPKNVTVECVDCHLRYAYGVSDEVTGHTLHLLVDANDPSILCGQFLNSKSLAYCSTCGLVIDLTGREVTIEADGTVTFTDSKLCADYVGKENLDEAQLAALEALLDKYDNLNVNLRNVIKTPAEEGKDAVYYDSEGLRGLVITAYKSEDIKLHEFKKTDDYKLMLQSDGCEGDAAWVYVCSICGVRDATAEDAANHDLLRTVGGKIATIKADTVLDHKDDEGNITLSYQEYLSAYTAEKYGSKPAGYLALGYTQITKSNDVTVTGETAKSSLYKLYNKLVPEIVTLAEGETFHGPSSFYTWYNFAAFAYQNGNHNFLNGNGVVECQMDPILQFLLEDFVGSSAELGNRMLIRSNGAGISTNTKAVLDDEDGTFEDLVEKLKSCIGDAEAVAAFRTTYAAWLDKPMKDYRVVADYLTKTFGATISNLPEGLKALVKSGVRDWCKNSTADPVCPLADTKAKGCTYGFVVTEPHANQYKIYKMANGAKTDETFDFVFTFDPETEWVAPTSANEITAFNATKPGWDEDLRFIQYLYNAKKAGEAGEDILALFDDYVNEEDGIYKDAIQYVVVSDEGAAEITCMVCEVCKYCGLVTPNDTHVKADSATTPEDKMNCQHGDRCVACKQSMGVKGAHNLVDAFTLTGTLKTAYEKLCEKNTTFLTADCWNGVKSITICVGCLEAWYNDGACDGANWVKPTGTGVANGWLKATITSGNNTNGGNYTKDMATAMSDVNPKHTFQLTNDNYASLSKLLGLKPTTAEGASEPTAVTKADVEKAILALFGEVKTVEGKNVAKYNDTMQLTFDDDGHLVLKSELKPDDGFCKGERYEQHLCLVCAIHFKGFTGVTVKDLGDSTKTGGFKSTYGVENATVATGASATQIQQGKENAYKQLVHVYALAKDPKLTVENGVYRVTTVCLRCKKEYRGLWTELEESNSKGGYVFAKKVEDIKEKADNGCAIDDYEALQKAWDELAYQGSDISYKVGDAEDLENGTISGSGYYAIKAAGGAKEVDLSSALKIDSNAEVVLDIAEGTTLKLSSTTESTKITGHLTIKGGTLELPAMEAGKNVSALSAAGEGASITLENVTVNTGSSLYASEKGKIEVINSFICSNGGYALASNNQYSPCTFVIKNSTIASMDQTNGVGTGNSGNVGLLINYTDDVVEAENSMFYGVCTGAWIRGGKATFKNCTFITGGAQIGEKGWDQGNYSPKEAKAALLVGNGGYADYGNTEVNLTGCSCIVSKELVKEGDDGKYVPNTDNKVTVDESAPINARIKATAYTGSDANKKIVLAAYKTSDTVLNLDQASANSFGVTTTSMVQDTNVYVNDGATLAQIKIKIGTGTTFYPTPKTNP